MIESNKMKNQFLSLLILTLLSCDNIDGKRNVNLTDENRSFSIHPSLTDTNYISNQSNHYIVRNTVKHNNKLFLFIGGTNSFPNGFLILLGEEAELGFDVISLSYPNKVSTTSFLNDPDSLVFDNFRDEMVFGNSVSAAINIDLLNSINTRVLKLLIYLKLNYSSQNWGQYLTNENTIKWEKIVVAGHSQGSGIACYIGKKFLVNRVIMFSGPNDFSAFYNKPAKWLGEVGLTPLNKHYALLHIQDEVSAFPYQVENLRKLGLLASTEEPQRAEELKSPYNNARCLSINIASTSYHSSTIGTNFLLPNIWKYMTDE
jgi:hypothetical protein